VGSRYAGAIARGRQENTHGSDPLHQQARTLLRRFQRHRDMILRFTVNLDVSFTNNTAELPARSVKVQQRTVRHEALLYRMEVRDLRGLAVVAVG
jgi:hypothetical protein